MFSASVSLVRPAVLALSFCLGACAWLPQTTEAGQSTRVVRDIDRWDLGHLYASPQAWSADLQVLNDQIPELASCQGRLGESARAFSRCLDLLEDSSKRMGRLYVYASARSDEDTRDAPNLERLQTLELAGSRLNEASSFLRPEVLALGERKLRRLLDSDPALARFEQTIANILRLAPHTLDAEGEAMLATLSLAAGASGSVYQIFSAADMPWPQIELNGQDVRLDQAAYTRHRADPDRGLRERVFDAFWGTWKDYERSLGVMLFGNVKEQVAQARVRNYGSAREAALGEAKIPLAVYDTLIEETNASLATLQRYFKLRGRMLGIDDLAYHDIYPPMVKSDRGYPVDEGKRIIVDAAAPLGEDYVAGMRKGLAERWMDVYPSPGKRSGAYMNPGAYDVHPYVLMNYNDDYESVSTLAHEWGHAMHSYLASRAQGYFDANYSIFTAEVASTVNEVLLLEHMLASTDNDELRLYYLGFALENMRGTFYRQAMFAEFERDIHAQVERGESLSGASLSRQYCELLKRYHGHAQGVLTIRDRECVEWAYIPHFYYNFYVYQYATSIAAGALFADRILAGEPGAREEYLGVLAAGGSEYPHELLLRAGIDLASPAPYQALAGRMNRIMDEIEAILDRRG